MSDQYTERFYTIEMYLQYWGKVQRQDLVRHHDIGNVTATRVLGSYADLNPTNLTYSVSDRAYIWTNSFCSSVIVEPETALKLMAYGNFTKHLTHTHLGPDQTSISAKLISETTAAITRSIVSQSTTTFSYTSGTSGATTKSICPHSLFRSGSAWYFRGYDIEKTEYRTYRFNRVSEIFDTQKRTSLTTTGKINDREWQQQAVLTLAPHTKHPRPDALKIDLGLENKPVKNITTNAVLAPFILTDLRVDCSENGTLNPLEYPLQLMNRPELSDISGMMIAPGHTA